MRYAYWVRMRAGRLLVIVLAIALYICLVIIDGMLSLPYEFANNRVALASMDDIRFSRVCCPHVSRC